MESVASRRGFVWPLTSPERILQIDLTGYQATWHPWIGINDQLLKRRLYGTLEAFLKALYLVYFDIADRYNFIDVRKALD
jgi:predicted protein tyrosine phosphatase